MKTIAAALIALMIGATFAQAHHVRQYHVKDLTPAERQALFAWRMQSGRASPSGAWKPSSPWLNDAELKAIIKARSRQSNPWLNLRCPAGVTQQECALFWRLINRNR